MPNKTITIRLPKSLVSMSTGNQTRDLLSRRGLDTRTMQCREDGDELVYEGAAVEKSGEQK